MARDRKRAKQRRAAAVTRRPRGGGGAANGAAGNGGAGGASEPGAGAPGAIERADLPGALEHIGSEDEFDAALVRGAGGTPAADVDEAELNAEVAASLASSPQGDGEDLLQESVGLAGAGGGGGAGAIVIGAGAEGARPSGAPLRGGNKAIGFLRASWAELQRVQWPDRRQVTQATAVVVGFVAIAGVYLGVADTVAKEIVEFIL
ncbi:MAG TPA: preprotein translocase subunit SecE [Solirubrobacteraceae bacterium]|nr:preprotein translocase subunit SecE [Solirubrobacteraceae bacterium]